MAWPRFASLFSEQTRCRRWSGAGPPRKSQSPADLVVHELPVGSGRHMDCVDLLTLRQTAQNPPGNLRQQRVGQNIVYVARAALDLGAAAGHLIDQGVVIRQLNPVVLDEAALDLAQLE